MKINVKTLKLEKQETILLADWLVETRHEPLRTCWHQRQIHTSVAVNTRRYSTHKGSPRRNIEFLVLVRALLLLHQHVYFFHIQYMLSYSLVNQLVQVEKTFAEGAKG